MAFIQYPTPTFKIPYIFAMDDNGAEVGAAYDTMSIIHAFMARLPWSDSDDAPAESDVERYLTRVDTCKSCVAAGQAYCDRYNVLEQTVAPGYLQQVLDNTQNCYDKTADGMEQCQSLSIEPTFAEQIGAGGVFQEQMCPCYDGAGAAIQPAWVTKSDYCEKIYTTEAIEAWRESQEESEHETHGAAMKRMELSARLEFAGIPGCGKGYQCCAHQQGGVQFQRCVNSRDLQRSRKWWKRAVSTRQSCADFKPPTTSGGWADAADDQCLDAMSGFEGFWSYKRQDRKRWSIAASHEWTRDEVGTGDEADESG